MPMYSLVCVNEKCKHTYDELLKWNEPLPKCPKCGEDMERMVPKIAKTANKWTV